MTITIRYSGPGLNRKMTKGNELISLDKSSCTLEYVLAEVEKKHGEGSMASNSRILLLVNGSMVTDRGRMLFDGDRVELLSIAAGG